MFRRSVLTPTTFASLLVLAIVHAAAAQPSLLPKTVPQSTASRDPFAFEARLLDNSTIKLMIKEEKIDFITPYGKLVIPFHEIRRIELGLRISEETSKRIERAISHLGSSQYRVREDAGKELLGLRDKAYPSLVAAAGQADPEIVRRAEKLLAQMRESNPQELLDLPHHDIVHTADSRFAGHVSMALIRVQTAQFGDLQLKLSDVRYLKSGTGSDSDGGNALADPGTLVAYAGMIGKTFVFRVTGTAEGNLWGTGLHTLDSSLAKAAVQSGALRPGQLGLVKVSILPGQASFVGSTQNGVTSSSYGPYQGSFKVEK